MKILILLLISLGLSAKVVVIQTEDVLGKCVIEYGDTVILWYGNNLEYRLSQLPIDLVMCGSDKCTQDKITELQHRYRTNGITISYIK